MAGRSAQSGYQRPRPDHGVAVNDELELVLAERAIQRVITIYSRGVDRFDFELVRQCYWPDGTDDHGSFVGGVDDFIAFVQKSLTRFERTAHFLGNMLIDVDLGLNLARAETYAVAFHRYSDSDGYPTDMWAGLRYVDRFERRDGEWRIQNRVCAFDWRRTDRVEGEGGFADSYVRGMRSREDIVYHILE
jgi:SnoaL-like domain